MARNSTKPKDETTPAVEDKQANANPTPATEDEQVNANPTPATEDEQANANPTPATEDEQVNANPTPATEDEQVNATPSPAVDDQGAAGASPCSVEQDGTAYAPIKLKVISARGLALRERPGKQFAMLAVLPTGTVLTGREADETAEGWIAVQTKDGKAGYVDTRFVTVVD